MLRGPYLKYMFFLIYNLDGHPLRLLSQCFKLFKHDSNCF